MSCSTRNLLQAFATATLNFRKACVSHGCNNHVHEAGTKIRRSLCLLAVSNTNGCVCTGLASSKSKTSIPSATFFNFLRSVTSTCAKARLFTQPDLRRTRYTLGGKFELTFFQIPHSQNMFVANDKLWHYGLQLGIVTDHTDECQATSMIVFRFRYFLFALHTRLGRHAFTIAIEQR